MPPAPAKRPWLLPALFLLAVSACVEAAPEPTATPSPQDPATSTTAPTLTYSATATATNTATASITPTETQTPTPSDTPTPEGLTATATGNVNCRWGPGTAYIAYGSFLEGDQAEVEARDFTSQWVFLQPPSLDVHCWVAVSAVELNGPINLVGTRAPSITSNSEVPAPSGVSAVRNGGSVTITWNHIADAPERGYLLEVVLCINGNRVNQAFAAEGTSITLNDATNCSGASGGTIRGKNRLGYSSAVTIPWP